jgi:hypothetical protein
MDKLTEWEAAEARERRRKEVAIARIESAVLALQHDDAAECLDLLGRALLVLKGITE